MRPFPGVIRGQVFRDLDRDGIRDADELGQGGWKIYLDLNEDGILDTGEPSTFTDYQGEYSFSNLAAFSDVHGCPAPTRVLGTDLSSIDRRRRVEGRDRCGHGGQELVSATPIVAPADKTWMPSQGRLFADPNGNGIQDAGSGIAGPDRYFSMRNNNGHWDAGERNTLSQADNPATTQVNEAGDYLFGGLAPACTPCVRCAMQGWVQTTPMDNDLTSPKLWLPPTGQLAAGRYR